MNIERKLASIQVIKELKSIQGADYIEIAVVLGWNCVVQKGEFKPGDKCVYFELDSFLPIEERYEVLRRNSYCNHPTNGEGFRLKTQTFRGCISQGFVLPLSSFPEISDDLEVGTDLTKVLKVKSWEIEGESDLGRIIGSLPAYVKRTEEYRIQSFPELLDELRGKPYYGTYKIDGESITVAINGNQDILCGHECQVVFDKDYKYYDTMTKLDIFNRLKTAGYSHIAVQGEMAGPGIHKNTMGLKEIQFFVFNAIDTITMEHYDYDELLLLIERTGLQMVPLFEVGTNFKYTMEELLEMSNRATYPSTGRRAEGLVFRSTENIKSETLGWRKLAFKVINNKYLLKHE